MFPACFQEQRTGHPTKMLNFSKRDKKKASDAATAEKIKLPHSYSMTAPMPI